MGYIKSLSVVIPVFNGELFIREAVTSIFDQTYLPDRFEILLIDDGSSDQSLAICTEMGEKYEQVNCISLGHNQGVAKARNTGATLANYEYLAFLDQDDVWSNDKLAIQSRAIKEHPEADYILGMQSFSRYNIETYPKWFKTVWENEPQKGYVFGSILIEKNIFLDVGLLKESYRYGGDDVDWFARAKDVGKRELILPNIILHRKIHAQNASQRTLHSNSELLKVIKAKLDRAK